MYLGDGLPMTKLSHGFVIRATNRPRAALLQLARSARGSMTEPPPELLEFLYPYDRGVQTLALALRSLVHDEMAPCHEYIFEMRSKVVLLYSSTDRVIADGICNIGVFRGHVTLGFTEGADLSDPAGILQGSGKLMRHIAIRRLSELDRPEIRPMLRRARKHAGLTRRRPGVAADVTTRVKPRSLRFPR